MAFQQWRRFNFFEKDILKDPVTNSALENFKNVNITAAACGRGQCIIGDAGGSIFLLDRDVRVSFFSAYEIRVSHLFQLKQHNILVSVGEDEPGVNPLIKVWNFDKLDKVGSPTCCRIVRAIPGSRAVRVTSIVAHENLSQMAVGFEDGSVLVLKGDLTRERNSKQRVIHQDNYPVTGLAYRQLGNSTILFVSTTESVTSYNLSSKDRKEALDAIGCEVNCSVMTDVSQDNRFVIARTDALFFYDPESKGICLAFEGEKKLVTWFRGYLIVVSKELKQMQRQGAQAVEMNILTVYDIQNKFIAYTSPFPAIVDVLGEWGSLIIFSSDGKVYRLLEKDTQTKLETLFKKNMYDMAISLARTQQYSDGLMEIFRQYGDHLYFKGDFDGAMQQYIRTIGELEASYVIRKFLDAQRIHNLTEYLQALHEQGIANPDHTTLLLNCYTKLKAIEKLDDFIKTKKGLNFDVDTAIKVCRQAGYVNHALILAEKYYRYEWYLKIQLEDVKDHAKALSYIAKLDFSEAEGNMIKYGKVLVNSLPDETTEFLKKLCTKYQPLYEEPSFPTVPPESVTETDGDMSPTPSTVHGIMNAASLMMVPTSPTASFTTINRANPEDFIHIFVHQKSKLKDFLEYMVQTRNDCSRVVFHTLIELYLHDAAKAAEAKDFVLEAEQEKKCLDVLTGATAPSKESHYDLDHALVLAQMHNFKDGILYLYEKAALFQQIMQFHMDHNAYGAVIEDCKKYGMKDPSLWNRALAYFAKKEEDCKTHLAQVLSHIDKYNLLSPLLVVQTLAQYSSTTLSVVKEYIVRRLQHENEQITRDEKMIRQYKEDTEKMRGQITELKTCAKIFQNSKCMICSRALELPTVHFLCGDSFHQGCFESYAENENECPACMPENRKLLDIIKAQDSNKDLHEQFHHQLERSADGFSTIADYFGRGVFNKVTIFSDEGLAESVDKMSIEDRSKLL